jgi:hypothetical protein
MTKVKISNRKVKRNQTAICNVVLGVTGQENYLSFSIQVDPEIFTITSVKRGINMPPVTMDSIAFEPENGTIHVASDSPVNLLKGLPIQN